MSKVGIERTRIRRNSNYLEMTEKYLIQKFNTSEYYSAYTEIAEFTTIRSLIRTFDSVEECERVISGLRGTFQIVTIYVN